jgi:polar amino acid transport system substrate-binding protein
VRILRKNIHITRLSARVLLLIFSVFIYGIPEAAAKNILIPNFWDHHERFSKPDNIKIGKLNFITTANFPPFSFINEEKHVSGFNVDLARAICVELDMQNNCSIQALPWNEQEASLGNGVGTALISGLVIDASTRKRLAFTRPYLVLPARFIVRKEQIFAEPLHQSLRGKIVGVIANTAHEEYLKQNFDDIQVRLFSNQASALGALGTGKIDAVFSSALSLSSWLHSNDTKGCCRFISGPYISSTYFGHGLAIAVKPGNKALLDALNYALHAITEKGVFSEIYLRYFPVGLY